MFRRLISFLENGDTPSEIELIEMRPEAKSYFLERGIRFMLSEHFGRKDSDRLLVPGDLLEK